MSTGPVIPVSALLRVGFAEPPGSPRALVRSYRTVSPLPVRARGPAIGGLFSVALSCGSPRLAVSEHPALRSPDLPRPGRSRAAAIQPTHRHASSVPDRRAGGASPDPSRGEWGQLCTGWGEICGIRNRAGSTGGGTRGPWSVSASAVADQQLGGMALARKVGVLTHSVGKNLWSSARRETGTSGMH